MKHSRSGVIGLALCITLLLSACSALQREQAGEAAVLVGAAAAEIESRKEDPLADVAELVQQQLDAMYASGVLSAADYQASVTALQQTLAELDEALPAPEVVQAWVEHLRRFEAALQRVADAPDDATAAAEAIAGAAAMAAPLAGPYAPFVALGGAALSAIVGLFYGRSRGMHAGITLGIEKVSLPIESAREAQLEEDLARRHPGRRFIVVDRDRAAKKHVRNGAATAIEQATARSAA